MNTDTDSNSSMKLIKTMEILTAKQIAYANDLLICRKTLGNYVEHYSADNLFNEC